jgi:hypothetical protein
LTRLVGDAFLVSVGGRHYSGLLYGGLFYLRVSRFQVEKDLDGKALLIFAFEVATTPTIQLVHHCSGFPNHSMRIPFLAQDTFFDFSQLVMPEQLQAPIVQQDVQCQVLRIAPPSPDRT